MDGAEGMFVRGRGGDRWCGYGVRAECSGTGVGGGERDVWARVGVCVLVVLRSSRLYSLRDLVAG